MGWIGCVRCEKFRCDFVARTFALIAPVQPVLHQASCSNETIQNAPKHCKTQQYMSLGSNGVGRVHSLRKIPKQLRGTNLCINCPVQPVLHRVSCSNETLPNAPKHYETHQNMSLWSNGVDRVRSLRKIPLRFHCTNLCNNCTSSTLLHRVSCSNKTLTNAPKHYENTPKHEFRVQLGLRVFVAKNSDGTSWHELLH